MPDKKSATDEILPTREVAMKTSSEIRRLFWIRIMLKALILCIVVGIIIALRKA